MYRNSTSAQRVDDYLETDRLALLHQVEDRIRARSERKRQFMQAERQNRERLENQIAALVDSRNPVGKQPAASTMKNLRNLIEFHLPDARSKRGL